jgi:hypothetical protein
METAFNTKEILKYTIKKIVRTATFRPKYKVQYV